MEKVDLVILGATPVEMAPLAEFFKASNIVEIAGKPFSTFFYHGRKVLIGITGIGKVNAAATAAATLSNFRTGGLWNVGCAGAYEGSGLEIGDVLITENCICADEGILGNDGPMPTSSIEIPLVIKGGQAFHDFFPLCTGQIHTLLGAGLYSLVQTDGVRQVYRSDLIKRPGSFQVQYGPGLTVSMVSGDIQTARERFRRFGALAENMEGSALAQTCLLFDVPFLEFRGISNMAGVRDKTMWDFGKAIEHCLAVLIQLLNTGLRHED